MRRLVLPIALLLLAACASPTPQQPVTTDGGTPVTINKTPVQAEVGVPMATKCEDPILADGGIAWPNCKIKLAIGQFMVLPAQAPTVPTVDSLGKLAVWLTGQELTYLATPNELPVAYVVPYSDIVWKEDLAAITTQTRTWIAQSSRETSRSLTGLNVKVTIALAQDNSPNQPRCDADKPWNAFQVTFHLTRGSGMKWGPSINDTLGHCVGGFDADVLNEIKTKISAFLSMLGAEGAELLKTLTGLY